MQLLSEPCAAWLCVGAEGSAFSCLCFPSEFRTLRTKRWSGGGCQENGGLSWAGPQDWVAPVTGLSWQPHLEARESERGGAGKPRAAPAPAPWEKAEWGRGSWDSHPDGSS